MKILNLKLLWIYCILTGSLCPRRSSLATLMLRFKLFWIWSIKMPTLAKNTSPSIRFWRPWPEMKTHRLTCSTNLKPTWAESQQISSTWTSSTWFSPPWSKRTAKTTNAPTRRRLAFTTETFSYSSGSLNLHILICMFECVFFRETGDLYSKTTWPTVARIQRNKMWLWVHWKPSEISDTLKICRFSKNAPPKRTTLFKSEWTPSRPCDCLAAMNWKTQMV